MYIETIRWKKNALNIIDQTQLPEKLRILKLRDIKEVWGAIKKLRVRGAPAIGIAGAFGVYLGIRNFKINDYEKCKKEVERMISYLATSRPTAVNLFWALERIRKIVDLSRDKSIKEIKKLILNEAMRMIEEDDKVCKTIGEVGAGLLKSGDTVLTHCNAGGLATASYGTALSIVYRAVEQGKKISVFVDETRPLLQGARLTTWELMRNKIPVTLICDNMSATIMAKGLIQAVVVGADRIAMNGDLANKIGTYGLAILAKYHNIPFYCAAPLSTFDPQINSGAQIPIEERSKDEIISYCGKRIAPANVKVFNPAFDVTPAKFVTVFITEKGVLKPPFQKSIKLALLEA